MENIATSLALEYLTFLCYFQIAVECKILCEKRENNVTIHK